MPPLPSNSQIPKPRVSSPSILAALRGLAGQRKPSTSLSTASTPAAESPATGSLLSEPSSSSGRQPLKRGKTTPLLGLYDANGERVESAHHEPQIAGPAQLGQFVNLLGPENDLEERILAADAIAALLGDYPVGNISVIWNKASDLLTTKNKTLAFEAGFGLLLASINHSSLELVERPLFFASASAPSLLEKPSLCLGVLSALTNHGKSLEGLDSGELAYLLVKLLDKSYVDAVSVRRKARLEKANSSSIEESTLADVFRYVLDTIKFSSKVFEELHLNKIIEHTLLICKKTRAQSDLEHSLGILDTVITYSVLPKVSQRACVEVLCGIFCSVDKLKPQSKSTFWKLLRSYLWPDVLAALQDILLENSDQPAQDRNVVRGSVQFLQEFIRDRSQDFAAKVTLSELLPALLKSLSLDSASLELDVLDTLCLILKTPDLEDLVFAEAEWTEFSAIVIYCANGRAVTNLNFSASPNKPGLENPLKLNKDSTSLPRKSNIFQSLAQCLLLHSHGAEPDRAFSIMSLLLRVGPRLDDTTARAVVEFYINERLLFPSQDSWFEDCQQLQNSIVHDDQRSNSIRLLSLKAFCNAYSSAEALNATEAEKIILLLVETISMTKSLLLLGFVIDYVVGVAEWTTNDHVFISIVDTMQQMLYSVSSLTEYPEESRFDKGTTFLDEEPKDELTTSTSAIIASGLVKIFLRCFNRSSDKTEKLFQTLLSIARSSEPPADARIIALKVLARLRADVSYAAFVATETESESLAPALCRTTESAAMLETIETVSRRGTRDEEIDSKRSPTSPTQPSTAIAPGTRSITTSSRGPNPIPPLWMYPEPNGLPEEPPSNSSCMIYSHVEIPELIPSATDKDSSSRAILKTGLWLELTLDILQREELEWETYSYVIVHLGAQLMNQAFFVDSGPQIKLLRSVLCDLLQNKKFHEPPASTKLKRSDVAICLYHVLAMLVCYRHLFAKSEEDEMVKTFVFGMGSSEKTSEICIHALSVCCHEMPMSIVKYLDTALQKMTQIITQSNIAAHVLEFLAGLARLPSLFRNFREDEFKSVFGICFRYLQYVRDHRSKSIHPTSKTGSSHRPNRDVLPTSDSRSAGPSLAEVLPQYVYALAYHVMTFWFMAIKLQDRPRQMAWIRKNLIFTNERGEQVMEEQSQVIIDLMHRVAYSDRDETMANPSFARDADGMISSKSYLVGLSILTVATAGRTGVSHITIRRPSGNKYSVSRPQVTHLPRHQAAVNEDTFYSADYVGVTPEDVVQNLYSPLSISPSLASLTEGPIPLPDDEATRRSIGSFDRISALDGHKVGIIYIGENQTSEVEILANVMGSADYVAFLNDLGTLTELKGASFNTQGLDREYGTDGKFTFCWRDRVSELVFHVTTMMPTDLERDPQCSLKKRHVGNDFVNIIFNNSGKSFVFDTFPSDFNYVNVVISPEARSSFIETRLHAAQRKQQREKERHDLEVKDEEDTFRTRFEPEDDMFYKVTVMTKPGLPKISPASDTKTVSGKNLAAFVRLLALNASVFAQVWANRAGGEHVSSWRSRLREIVRLRERHAAPVDAQVTESLSCQQAPQQAQSNNNDRSSGKESKLLRRSSAATFLSEGSANRASGLGVSSEPETADSSVSHD